MHRDNKQANITLAQINPTVGDLKGNLRLIVDVIRAHQVSSDLIIFPELCVTGYPPEDLLLRDDFLAATLETSLQIKNCISSQCSVIIGLPLKVDGHIFNALQVLNQKGIQASYYKRLLPNYTVFDEKRYFSPGLETQCITIAGIQFGLTICEDIWEPEPIKETVDAGADCIISINASPFHYRKSVEREQGVVVKRATENQRPIIYVNQYGGQDELVFDGASIVVDQTGKVITKLPSFESSIQQIQLLIDINGNTSYSSPIDTTSELACSPDLPDDENASLALIYKALVTGVRDYVQKNGFEKVILGLSGGIDSALVVAIAVDALGKEAVEAVMMPYHYTSDWSIEDADKQAKSLGIAYHVIPIETLVSAALDQLEPVLVKRENDTTEENIQARSRGLLLMAISNNSGAMVLTTGNKSEMAVGYATLYGDMAGGFAAIKDVPKTLVYQLAGYRNTLSAVIPERVITRPPSAELRPDQVDQDSLPDYDILDAILERFVELDQSPSEIIEAGFDTDVVNQVIKMVVRNEYKRRQAAPGIRITPRAFGRDRRYPITSGFF